MANLPVMLVEWRVGDVIRRLRLTVARMLGHSRIETAQRYAQGAFQDVDREAQAKVNAKLER